MSAHLPCLMVHMHARASDPCVAFMRQVFFHGGGSVSVILMIVSFLGGRDVEGRYGPSVTLPFFPLIPFELI